MSLSPSDLTIFGRLGIPAELLEQAGIERVTDAEARQKFGLNGSGDRAGIVFPYLDPLTGLRATARLRRDNPDIEAGKPKNKYISAYGDRRHLYFVPGHAELVTDATVPVALVEAEKSALALTAWAVRTGRQLLPVAMGGCWGWRGRIGKVVNSDGNRTDEVGPLPELLKVCTAGRTVYVLLDANCATNPKVQDARAALVRVLQKQKVKVKVLDLPTVDGVNGPDDFIGVKGDDAMAALFDGAEAGAAILDDVAAFIKRFVVLSDTQIIAVTLWCVHTWAFFLAVWTPYLEVTSSSKRSGKSRLLEVLGYLVRRPWWTSGATAASLFREIDQKQPTLLFDELDTTFKGDPETAQAIRQVLNSGAHHKGSVARCVGKGTEINTKNFKVFCPKALAGIGRLPDTIHDRSLSIKLQRKMPTERVERLRERTIGGEAERLRDRLSEWVDAQRSKLRSAEPETLAELNDRQQDGAEPLLALADAAGVEWPEKARKALIELYTGAAASDEDIGVQLLADIHAIFDSKATDRIFSEELADALGQMEEKPWAEFGKASKPITKATLGKLLSKRYDISPRNVRVGDSQSKGYQRAWFQDLWNRYLPYTPPSQTSQASQASIDAGLSHFSECPNTLSGTDAKSEFSPTAERVGTHGTDEKGGIGGFEDKGPVEIKETEDMLEGEI